MADGDWADLHGEANDILYADWPHDEERAAADADWTQDDPWGDDTEINYEEDDTE